MLHEKILRASIAAVFEGRIDDAKIKCTSKQKKILEYAFIATKNFQNIIESTDASLSDVKNALLEYKRASDQFSVAFNISWPM